MELGPIKCPHILNTRMLRLQSIVKISGFQLLAFSAIFRLSGSLQQFSKTKKLKNKKSKPPPSQPCYYLPKPINRTYIPLFDPDLKILF